MKRFFLFVFLMGGALAVRAQELPDSLSVEELQQAVVSAVRSPKDAPLAVSNVSRRELEDFSSSGRELPMLLSRTPGVLSWSENGVGTGTTYLRIRGAGGSRINVTLDGVPLNSPEDQTVFWANMNSYSSLLGSVQLQRGVGSSTTGDGAFGGSVALGMKAPSLVPAAEVVASYGSWNTLHYGADVSTGLLWNHLIMDFAYHRTSTDGFVHGTDGVSGSYLGALSWIGDGWKLSYKLLGNHEVTGQAWNGVTAGTDDLSIMDGTYGAATGIRTYADMWNAGLGLYNSLYERMIIDGNNYSTERYALSDGTLWPRTTDNFFQTHHILNYAASLSAYSRLSLSAHYTAGEGWYDEFRYNNKLSKYGIAAFKDADGTKVKKSDFVRRKGLRQDTFGLVGSYSYERGPVSLVSGLSAQQFLGDHYGYLLYAGNDALSKRLGISGELYSTEGKYKYYDSPAAKTDASAFAKVSLRFGGHWSAFADLQLRYVRYRTDGYNDKYIDAGDGIIWRHFLDIDEQWLFFNPKAGFNWSSGPHRAYFSFAIANREPERNNFTDNGHNPYPTSESVMDYELGWQFSGRSLRLSANLFYMRYRDQLVQTGQLSDIGEALTINIPDSFRAGAELSAAWDVAPWLTLEGNAALMRSRLLGFDEHVEDWDLGERVVHYDSTPIAFSPDAIVNGFADLHFGSFKAVWHTGYVSRMYLDNSGCEARSLPAYSLSSLELSYTFRFRKVLKAIELGVEGNNLSSARVSQGGWVYSAVCESYGHPESKRYYQIGFVPVAPLSVLGHIKIII